MTVLEPADIRAAAQRLDGVAVRTPVVTSPSLDEAVGGHVLFKAEALQRTGSFKFRGAYNKIATLDQDELRRGVLAVSSGNHAQAVALAAKLLGTTAVIVMPSDAPANKVEGTRSYGAEVITYDRYGEDREAIGSQIVRERGLVLVHPFDDPLVIAGQGTAALELLEDEGELDLLIAPVSGGGLIAGCATALKSARPNARVIGVEPETGDDHRQSLAAGRRVTIEVPRTVADALQLTSPGRITFPINRSLLDAVVTVSDVELIGAMRLAFEWFKLVLEPAGAAALAALVSYKAEVKPAQRVGAILSGGNIDPAMFCRLLSGASRSGDAMGGRSPGQNGENAVDREA